MLSKLVILLISILLLIVVNIVGIQVSPNSFNSSDEASNYVATKRYGTKGVFYGSGKYLSQDNGNNLHQRGILTHNNKLVPFNFLGLPFIYGTFYHIIGDYIVYINNVFAVMIFILLYKCIERRGLKKKQTLYIIFPLFLLCSPLLYYINFSYYNILPFISFALCGVYMQFFFLHSNAKINNKYLVVTAIFFGISIYCRYEQIIFVSLLYLIVFIGHLLKFKDRLGILKYSLISALFICFSFGLPVLFTNKQTYGSYSTYGYSLFIKTYFNTERNSNTKSKIINILFPSQTINRKTVSIRLFENFYIMSPVLYLFGIMGVRKLRHKEHMGLYILLLIYIIAYNGFSNTYTSNNALFSISSAVNRYRIVLHIFFLFTASVFVSRNKCMILLTLFFSLINLSSKDGILQTLEKEIEYRGQYILFNNKLRSLNISNKYIIDPINCKYLFVDNLPITWRGGAVDGDYHFSKRKNEISSTVKMLLQNGEEVYALQSRYFSNTKHMKELRKEGLVFKHVNENLFKIYFTSGSTEK